MSSLYLQNKTKTIIKENHPKTPNLHNFQSPRSGILTNRLFQQNTKLTMNWPPPHEESQQQWEAVSRPGCASRVCAHCACASAQPRALRGLPATLAKPSCRATAPRPLPLRCSQSSPGGGRGGPGSNASGDAPPSLALGEKLLKGKIPQHWLGSGRTQKRSGQKQLYCQLAQICPDNYFLKLRVRLAGARSADHLTSSDPLNESPANTIYVYTCQSQAL